MEFTREDLKKVETWIILVPAILLFAGLITMYSCHQAKTRAIAKVNTAEKVVKSIKELQELSQGAKIDLSKGSTKKEFETVNSMIECAKAAKIPALKIKRISGDKPKKLKDGKMEFRESFELNDVRMQQIGLFIDFAERNFESLICTNIAITPSANKSEKDQWNTTVQFEHIK